MSDEDIVTRLREKQNYTTRIPDVWEVMSEAVDEIEALRSAVRTLNGTMVGDFFFATYLSHTELAAMRRALNDRFNQGER